MDRKKIVNYILKKAREFINIISKTSFPVKYIFTILLTLIFMQTRTTVTYYPYIEDRNRGIGFFYNSITESYETSLILNNEKVYNDILNVEPYEYQTFGIESYININEESSVLVSALASMCTIQFVETVELNIQRLDKNLNTIDETYKSYNTSDPNYYSPWFERKDLGIENIDDIVKCKAEIEEEYASINDIHPVTQIVENAPYVRVELKMKMIDGSSFFDYRIFSTSDLLQKGNLDWEYFRQ